MIALEVIDLSGLEWNAEARCKSITNVDGGCCSDEMVVTQFILGREGRM
jgi:hypothetical protein